MKDYLLWEDKPAEKFCDAHYLGNGRLGMSVMGGAPLEEVYINDDTLWSGSEEFYLNPQHYDKFEEARRLSLEGKVKEANNIINNDMEGRWFEAYLPLASLHLTVGQANNRRNMPLKMVIEPQKDDISDYRRQLQLGTAVETVSWVRDNIRYTREYFVSFPDNKAFIYCTAEREEGGAEGEKLLDFAFGLDSSLHYVNGTQDGEAYLTGIAPDHAEPNYTAVTPRFIYKAPEESDAIRFACCARVVSCDGKVFSDGARVYVNHAGYALIAVQAKTNYAGFRKERDRDAGKLLEQIRQDLDSLEAAYGSTVGAAAKSISYASIKNRHISDYQSLYNRLDLDLGRELSGNLPTTQRLAYCAEGVDDPSLAALLLQYSRYLTIAGSRPGTQALNLQGIWNDTPAPPWSSNYTNNINVEMNYWPCEALGLPECHLPMMDLLTELSESGKQTAEGYYHSRGWVTHHNADLWRSTEPSCEDASWSWWPFGGAWMCQHIWTHYEFTRDEAFLRKMYPVLREAAVFMLDFLVENKEGYLVTAPSLSPENKFITDGEDTVIELIDEVSRESRCSPNHPRISAVTIGSTMDMSILRELFSNVAQAADILKLEDDPVPAQAQEAMKKFPPLRTGRFGQLLEWYEDYEECTPGMSHTSHMYPVYPGELITETRTPELFEAARRSLERRLLHARKQGGWPGSWKICLMARFKNPLECGHLLKSTGEGLGAGMMTNVNQQIDAIFGLGAGIAEMLLQSHQGFIELLPAVPVDWVDGHFRGMRARGGFEVSASWDRGKLRTGEIKALIGGPCCVKAKGLAGVSGPGVNVRAQDGIVSFTAEKGVSYVLGFDAEEIAGREYYI
ncbi:glycoside hydrolase family 95 protein [Eisenbergiella porci]|uniref:glycoside hydrolase family 95 protein n=2 Tax=Eisenbergiella porci TaxID=2652274 RepID=UPI00291346B8|nr:glycoside hydrolase family 95 protein [Eisenbergiella porci]MDU5289986.1 glycoside hydrolase family 95 protein [Clostridium sp.]